MSPLNPRDLMCSTSCDVYFSLALIDAGIFVGSLTLGIIISRQDTIANVTSSSEKDFSEATSSSILLKVKEIEIN